jgi:hypothetical protein
MNMTLFGKLPHVEKARITAVIRNILEKHDEISFAYLHGSFIREGGFRDIDVALFLAELPESPLQYELACETEIMAAVTRYPVDVRVLNSAPLSFKYQVTKEGVRLFVRNDDERAAFQESTLAQYFDFAPFRALYMKETLGLGV